MVFEQGKKYKFSSELHAKDMGKHWTWPAAYDGVEVTPLNGQWAKINGITSHMHRDWCEEVEEKKMAKFKKGDRVVFISDSKFSVFPPQFTRGTVDGHVDDDPEYMFVWWDVRPSGYPDSRTACPEKYAVLASEYKPERAPSRSIHISEDADGKTIHAVMKQGDKVVRREKAVCNPSDTYDFETGATVAFGRLFGKECHKPETKPDKPKEDKPVFSWDAFKAGKIAVHCDTEEKAVFFLKECERVGLKWSMGESPTHHINWQMYKSNTCYVGKYRGDGMEYCSFTFYKDHGMSIVQFPFYREVKREAKVGEKIKIVNPALTFGDYKNGDVFTVKSIESTGVLTDILDRVPDGCRLVLHREYVVLEGYDPAIHGKPATEGKQERREPKRGDKFVVVGSGHPVSHFLEIGSIATFLSVTKEGNYLCTDASGVRRQRISPADLKPYEG